MERICLRRTERAKKLPPTLFKEFTPEEQCFNIVSTKCIVQVLGSPTAKQHCKRQDMRNEYWDPPGV